MEVRFVCCSHSANLGMDKLFNSDTTPLHLDLGLGVELDLGEEE